MKNNYKNFIVGALKESSKIAVGYFGKVSGITKPDDNNQVLTKADLAIGKKVISLVCSKYPEHNIIDEEAGVIDNGSEFTWVIDPIDGTSNFARGIITYGIIIGLLKNDTPIAGGIALPAFSEIYIAEKGFGTFFNNKKIKIDNDKNNLLSELVSYGIDSNRENPKITRDECKRLAEVILSVRNIRTSGSIFDSVMVLRNKYGAHLSNRGKIWDVVGTQIIIEEAGGLFTDFFGEPMDYKNPLSKVNDNFTFCIGSKKLHEKIQKIINHQE